MPNPNFDVDEICVAEFVEDGLNPIVPTSTSPSFDANSSRLQIKVIVDDNQVSHL